MTTKVWPPKTDNVTFDRQRPLFRAFKSDEDDTVAWHYVSRDFTPGDELTESEQANLIIYFSDQPWWTKFLARLEENRKATIYATRDNCGEVSVNLKDEIDATISHATLQEVGESMVARGIVHDDRKGRFRTGELIRTSYIVTGPDEHGIVRTRNSVYKLLLKS